MNSQKKYCKKNGFTLVELAIVLVIIGLIIGGILVGADMIKSAEIRSTIGQYETFNTAINTFRNKYSGYPGDLENAENFGFKNRTSLITAATTGDDNGLIEDCSATPGMLVGCETSVFFEDMSFANILPDAAAVYQGSLRTGNHTNGDPTSDMFPVASIDPGTFFTVYSNTGYNWYHLSGLNDAIAGPATLSTIEPIEAFGIDDKIDDGIANTGLVRAVEDRGVVDSTITGASGDCLAAAGTYNTDEDNAGESIVPSCQLMMRISM